MKLCFKLSSAVILLLYTLGSDVLASRRLGTPDQNQCSGQMFDQDSVVCVCDEKYCDSLVVDEFPLHGQYTLIMSDRDGQRFSTSTGYVEPLPIYDPSIFECSSIVSNRTVYLTPNRANRDQKILGFGGAFTDAVGYNLNQVSKALVDQIFNAYFGYEGLRYNLARNTMAASDFSQSEYYYDNTDFDINMTHFRIAQEDYLYRIPYIQKAQSMVEEGLLLFASLWTCPAWMRGYNDDNRRVLVLEKYYESFCLYIMRYLEAYKEQGMEHFAVAFANEPISFLGLTRPMMQSVKTVWTLDRLINFAENYFIPALTERFPDTKMVLFDDNWVAYIETWLDVLDLHPNLTSKIELAGIHHYAISMGPGVLDRFHQRYPQATIVTTEYSTGTPGILGSWAYAEYYATAIIEEMNHHTSGWIDWNLLLDAQSQPSVINTQINSPIIVDVKRNIFYKQPSYYAIGHFSKFIPRGSTKIGMTSHFATDLEYVCVQRPDGYLVAVLQNRSNDTVNINIINGNGIVSIPASPHSISTVIFL